MSIFETREGLEEVVAAGRWNNGQLLAPSQIEALRKLLEHPGFDEMPLGVRDSYYRSQLSSSASHPLKPLDGAVVLGWLLLVIGIVTAAISFAMNTSVNSTTAPNFIGDTYIPPSQSNVINIGLLQTQLMVFQVGVALALAGMLLICAIMVRDAVLSKAPDPK